jgi:hypothetical protein
LVAAASTLATPTRISTSLTCLPRGLGRQVLTTRGALRPRERRDRCCARVVARLPHPSGNKPRRQNWAKDHNKRAEHQFCPPPPLPPSRSLAAPTLAHFTISLARNARAYNSTRSISLCVTLVCIKSSFFSAF